MHVAYLSFRKKALSNPRYFWYNLLIKPKYILIGSFVHQFLTSNSREQVYNLINTVKNSNDLKDIASGFGTLEVIGRDIIRDIAVDTRLELDREAYEKRSKHENTDQIRREQKFWEDFAKAVMSTGTEIRSSPPKVALAERYKDQFLVSLEVEKINRKTNKYTNSISAPSNVTSQIDSVKYFYNHQTFDFVTETSTVGPNFPDSYTGWGCLHEMVTTVFFSDGSSLRLEYDACEAIVN